MPSDVPRILLVEDNVDQQMLVVRTLHRHQPPFRVETVDQGKRAIAKLQEQPFDLVLLDYNLPGLNGIQTLDKIRELPIRVPVVLMTGGGDETLAVTAMKHGVYDYVVKSTNYLDLLPAVITKALAQHRMNLRLAEAEERFRLLPQLSLLLSSEIQPGPIAERLVEGACQLIRADAALVYLVEPETMQIKLVTTKQMELDDDGRRGDIRQKGLFGAAARSRQNVLVDDLAAHPDAPVTPAHQPKLGSIMSLPLLAGERLLGVVVMGRAAGAAPFRSSDLDVVRSLTLFGATALEKARLYQESLILAVTDGLTGLNNHREFQRKLEAEVERSLRYQNPISLLLLDIDHFKEVNDHYGHQTGDAILKALAGTILAGIRAIDIAARYGGEEFAVILPETKPDGAKIVADRLRAQVESQGFVDPAGRRIPYSVSIGMAVFPGDADGRERLIEAADKALYHAKSAGRNTVKSYRELLQTGIT